MTEDFYPQDMWGLWNVKEPLTLNRYSYCAGNPLYYVDKNGHVINVIAGFVVGTIGGLIVGTVTEAGKLIEQGEDYDWQAGLFNIANTTAAGAVGGTVFGATLSPELAATAAGGTYGGLNELTGSVMRGDGILQTVENTARGTAIGSVAGYVGGTMGMGTAGYVAASGAPVLIQVAASGAVGGISSGATHRALTGQDTTPEAVAMDGIYGSLSALTFYGTGLAYERVTAPKLPNTYIRDRLAAAEEMNRSEGCDAGTDAYAAPSGGGGITSTIEVNSQTVSFGHGGRHLEGTSLNVNAVNQALANEVSTLNLRIGQFYKGQIVVDGVTIEYTSYGVSDGKINVGTYYPLE